MANRLLCVYILVVLQSSLVPGLTGIGGALSRQNENCTGCLVEGTDYMIDVIEDGFNTTVFFATYIDFASWARVIKTVHVALASIGFAANAVTLVTIAKNEQEFSMAMRALLKHQAFVDGLACVMGAVISIEPDAFWKLNYVYIDYIVCVFWHSQAIYWAVSLVSIWNLVLMAAERYIAVVSPHTYQCVKRTHIAGVFCVMYLCFTIFFLVSGFLRMTYFDSMCYTKIDPVILCYWSVTIMFVFYIIPMICFIVLYSRIVFTLRSRNRQGSGIQSDVIDAASATLLRMAIAVTSVFVVAIGYAQCYFTLVYTSVIPYVLDSPQERAAIVLNTCNVVANPFIYGFMLPAFRRSLKKTFCVVCSPDRNVM